MTPSPAGESLYVLAFGDRTLAFTADEFEAGLKRGLALTGGPATSPAANGGESERLLTAQQMETATQIPSGWYLESARRRSIPFVRLGRYPRFLLSKVIEHGLVTPPAEAGGEWGRKKDKRAAS